MGEGQNEATKTWDLPKAIRFILNQHSQGMKLEDLEQELAILKDDGVILDCSVANVLDAIDGLPEGLGEMAGMDDIDYLIYGTNRYFVYEL